MRKAVVDIGSNSVLLLVEEATEPGWKTVLETTVVTSLGEGVKETGLLSERGIERTLAALKQAKSDAERAGATTLVACATMAARIARNVGAFLDRAEHQGTPVQVLTGDQEAQLGFLSVANDSTFGSHPRLSIIDVGGQSTELVTADRSGERWNLRFRRSFPIGTLGLRGSVLGAESPDAEAILAATVEIDDAIGLGDLPLEGGQAIVLGATGTNLITIRERMTSWNPALVHGARLGYEEVSKAVGWLCSMTNDERRAIIGMEPGREKTLHIGALILERFLHATHVNGCRVSVRGWRHALLETGMPHE